MISSEPVSGRSEEEIDVVPVPKFTQLDASGADCGAHRGRKHFRSCWQREHDDLQRVAR